VIISAAIDSCRRELKHQQKRAPGVILLDLARHITWGPHDDKEFREQIIALLPLLDARIICEFLWPNNSTQNLAVEEAKRKTLEAIQSVSVCMNWRDAPNAKVMKKHVAQALGISPARVALAFGQARANIKRLI
jgi:hypothetical protein